MAELLKGKPVADATSEGLVPRIDALKGSGITPKLAIIRVGQREDDLSYERGAQRRFEGLGLEVERILLTEDCAQEDLMDALDRVNVDPAIHGCLLFRPLPEHLDETAACNALDPAKDVDGITETSLYGIFANQQKGFPPCTADACLKLMHHYGYELQGAEVTVVGRSLVIGKPVAMMLLNSNATVRMTHTRTRNLDEACRAADILVVACGHAGTLGADALRPGQIVVDVGINWDEEAQKLVGDVAFDEAESIVSALTPVPGGVGSVTTAVLAEHVVQAAERTLSD